MRRAHRTLVPLAVLAVAVALAAAGPAAAQVRLEPVGTFTAPVYVTAPDGAAG